MFLYLTDLKKTSNNFACTKSGSNFTCGLKFEGYMGRDGQPVVKCGDLEVTPSDEENVWSASFTTVPPLKDALCQVTIDEFSVSITYFTSEL